MMFMYRILNTKPKSPAVARIADRTGCQ